MKVTATQGLFVKNVTPVYLGSNSLHSKDMCGTLSPRKNAFPQFSQFHCTCLKWAHLLCTARAQEDEGGVREK